MCGRLAVSLNKFYLNQLFPDIRPFLMKPNYNLAPSQDIPAIKDMGRSIELLKWGLVPSWAKDKSFASKMINARSETVHEKPAFREAYKKRRCLLPATGYYEWKKIGKEKFPFYLGFNNKPFLMAGLWESWTDKNNGEIIETATILTCRPNDFTKKIHDRMPVILNYQESKIWLDKGSGLVEIGELLKPADSEGMTAWEVSKEVNSPKNNNERLIEPINEELF